MLNEWYKSALKKLNLSEDVLYDENGMIRYEFVLTDNEKKALLFFVSQDIYCERINENTKTK